MKTRAWDGERFRDDYVVMPDGTLRQLTYNKNYAAVLGGSVDWKLSRFTGLLDKNGKEIYEGDIREGTFYDSISAGGKKHTAHQVMQWNKTGACFEWLGPFIPDFCGIVIVGNIFQNPELLEVK